MNLFFDKNTNSLDIWFEMSYGVNIENESRSLVMKNYQPICTGRYDCIPLFSELSPVEQYYSKLADQTRAVDNIEAERESNEYREWLKNQARI